MDTEHLGLEWELDIGRKSSFLAEDKQRMTEGESRAMSLLTERLHGLLDQPERGATEIIHHRCFSVTRAATKKDLRSCFIPLFSSWVRDEALLWQEESQPWRLCMQAENIKHLYSQSLLRIYAWEWICASSPLTLCVRFLPHSRLWACKLCLLYFWPWSSFSLYLCAVPALHLNFRFLISCLSKAG